MLSTNMEEVAEEYLAALKLLQKKSLRIGKRLEARGEDIMALNALAMAQGYAAQAFSIGESYVRYYEDRNTPKHVKRQSILEDIEEEDEDDQDPFPDSSIRD